MLGDNQPSMVVTHAAQSVNCQLLTRTHSQAWQKSCHATRMMCLDQEQLASMLRRNFAVLCHQLLVLDHRNECRSLT